MLNREKLLGQLDHVGKNLFLQFAKEQDIAQKVWNSIKDDEQLCLKVHERKYSLLLPKWTGCLGWSKKIAATVNDYTVLAVDGSQIYYDKHQGPACYLINIGSILLQYSSVISSVQLASEPYVFMIEEENRQAGSTEFINLQREEYEFKAAWNISEQQLADDNANKNYMVLFDGSLIFFHIDSQGQDEKQYFLGRYFDYLQKFYDKKTLIAGYMSFPRSKELVNILKLVLAQFDEKQLQNSGVLDQLTDMDIALYFLPIGSRSTIFESKSLVSYLYPQESKPYFCYFNVGVEIIRLEFPAWIAQQENLVDQICAMALDQAIKGKGYPVCLFEAHEQAVVKGADREFFYIMMQKMSQKQNWNYQKSLKSIKKMQVPV